MGLYLLSDASASLLLLSFFLPLIMTLNLLPRCVCQAHLLSLFDNVNRVVFNEKIYDQMISFQSQEGETVELRQPVLAQVISPPHGDLPVSSPLLFP